MWCLINLPNGTTSGVQCDPKRNSQECLEKVSIFICTSRKQNAIDTSRNHQCKVLKLTAKGILAMMLATLTSIDWRPQVCANRKLQPATDVKERVRRCKQIVIARSLFR